jgi:hypothetical protein
MGFMKNVTKIVAGVVALLTAVLQVPTVQHDIGIALTAHPNIAAILAGITAIGMLIHQPNNGGDNGKASGS